MGELFELVEDYRRRFEPHPPSYSRIAEQVGVSRQTLLNWQAPTKLVDKKHLIAIADVTGVPYQRVLDALLADIGYLREGDVPVARAARNTGRLTQAERDEALEIRERRSEHEGSIEGEGTA